MKSRKEMTEVIRVTDDWDAFIKAITRKLQVSSLATGYYQVLESGKETKILRASVGELGYEAEGSKEDIDKKVEQLKSLLKGKSEFIRITKISPDELFYS